MRNAVGRDIPLYGRGAVSDCHGHRRGSIRSIRGVTPRRSRQHRMRQITHSRWLGSLHAGVALSRLRTSSAQCNKAGLGVMEAGASRTPRTCVSPDSLPNAKCRLHDHDVRSLSRRFECFRHFFELRLGRWRGVGFAMRVGGRPPGRRANGFTPGGAVTTAAGRLRTRRPAF